MGLTYDETINELVPKGDTPFKLEDDVSVQGSAIASTVVILPLGQGVSIYNLHRFLYLHATNDYPTEDLSHLKITNTHIPSAVLYEIADNAEEYEYYSLSGVLQSYLIYKKSLAESE